MTPGNTPEAWQRWLPRIYKTYAIAVGVCVVGAFTESFANLFTYFRHAGLIVGLAIIAPSMIDIFTVGGEGLVLLATVKHWPTRYKVGGWVATFAGLSVSVAGNVGKDGWRHLNPNKAVAYAIAPLALAGLLALGLAIVKRVLADEEDAAKAAAALADTSTVPAANAAPVVRPDIPAVPVTVTAEVRTAAVRRPRPRRPLSPATRPYGRPARTRPAATEPAIPAAAPAPSVIFMPWPVPARTAPAKAPRPPATPRPDAPAAPPAATSRQPTVKATPEQVRALRGSGLTPAAVAEQLGISERQERRLANPRQIRVLASANGSRASSNGSGS
jgi:hypothetical protein